MDNTATPSPQSMAGIDYAIIFNAASNCMAFTEADTGRIVDVNKPGYAPRASAAQRPSAGRRWPSGCGRTAPNAKR